MNEIWWSDVFAPKLVLRKVVSLVQGHCQLLQSHDGITVKKRQTHLSCTRTRKRQMPELSCTVPMHKRDIPCRTCVEAMARELGVMAELQIAETLIENEKSTLGFDATTKEGQHVNSIAPQRSKGDVTQ
ncbi:hypothetical protein LSH36_399g02023 [Paralvinella palmiformis]|uniref:Uncharacterized protein n=1 Tax=Paralvinella palmiformis TaxID=53620 RepID=A0AAD9MYK4_9ANNE|nr:hypothetical protein LSH36_399g02023 [Paralvinella palmiformis]